MEGLIELVRRYQSEQLEGKLRAGDDLALLIHPDLDRYVRSRYGGDGVEDIVQETLVGIVRGLDEFRGEADQDVRNWCFRIARNKVVNAIRRHERAKLVSLAAEELWRALEASAEEEPILEEEQPKLDYVMELIGSVDPPCVVFLQSRYVVGMPWKAIGEEHGISGNAARMAAYRCLALAQKLVQKAKQAYAKRED